MITIPKTLFYYMIFLIILFFGWYIYTGIRIFKARLDKTTSKKLKLIAKWEFRDILSQEKLIIAQYIDHYTRVHNIKWEEYL